MEVFTMLREQNLVEHANRQLKSPLAVSPLYLHTHRSEWMPWCMFC